MGQEAEKVQQLKDFAGFQVTEAMCQEGGTNPDWKFMHCLPQKQDELFLSLPLPCRTHPLLASPLHMSPFSFLFPPLST